MVTQLECCVHALSRALAKTKKKRPGVYECICSDSVNRSNNANDTGRSPVFFCFCFSGDESVRKQWVRGSSKGCNSMCPQTNGRLML